MSRPKSYDANKFNITSKKTRESSCEQERRVIVEVAAAEAALGSGRCPNDDGSLITNGGRGVYCARCSFAVTVAEPRPFDSSPTFFRKPVRSHAPFAI